MDNADARWEARQQFDMDEAEKYQPCASCDALAFNPQPCKECVESGHDLTARFCIACLSQCPSCSDWFCEEHASTKTKRCDECQRMEDGPSDYITEDHWQATQ